MLVPYAACRASEAAQLVQQQLVRQRRHSELLRCLPSCITSLWVTIEVERLKPRQCATV